MTKQTYVAFAAADLLARAALEELVRRLHPVARDMQAELRIFDEGSGRPVDFDWRGDADEVLARAGAQLGEKPQIGEKARGRPKLGVESREITLLPRHWTWLEAQGGNASATLRRLIDKEAGATGDAGRDVDAIYRLSSALAGDLPNFEEAARHLYRGEWDEAAMIYADWPGDIGRYLAERARAVASRR